MITKERKLIVWRYSQQAPTLMLVSWSILLPVYIIIFNGVKLGFKASSYASKQLRLSRKSSRYLANKSNSLPRFIHLDVNYADADADALAVISNFTGTSALY
ncbi:hypothetical protein AQAU111925_08260 [Aquirufa aurantiipilula]